MRKSSNFGYFGALLLLSELLVVKAASGWEAGHDDGSYDFIIVGGGTAGCAVAARLSESGQHTVLVIHEGGFPEPNQMIPALATEFWNNTKTARSFEISTGHHYPATPFLVGRALGGTSSINALFMNRGNPLDYDNWAYNITEDPSWSYKNMLKYFKKSESYTGDFPSDQHGYNGPMPVSRPKYSPSLKAWLEAGQILGYKISDPNGPQKLGFAPVEFNKRNGRRVSSFRGYLEPVMSSRKNLHILTNAEATRIVFERNKAIGVAYIWNSSTTGIPEHGFARVRKEIIVSGGFIGSPTLLMRSGIGPKDVLRAANITPVKILPVGRNLHDHPSVFIDFVFRNTSMFYVPKVDLNPGALKKFVKYGDGPYASFLSFEQAFLASTVAQRRGNGDWPDIQLFPTSIPSLIVDGALRGAPIADDEHRLGCYILVGRPYSRGVLALNASNPQGPPVINFDYLSNPLDRQIMLDGIRAVFKIYRSPAYRHAGIRYTADYPLPACRHLRFDTDEYWDCYIETVQTTLHGAGTCKMGRGAEDPTAVIDSKLRVIGIEGLRVVDASIMPEVTNANPQAALYGIAEKASDDILTFWEKTRQHPRRNRNQKQYFRQIQ